MEEINFERSITKTSFTRGWQCTKHLWFHRNQPLFNKQQDKQVRSFKRIDNPVFELAYQLFPEGRSCSTNDLEEDKDWNLAVEKTAQLIAAGEQVLYNPTFKYGRLLCDLHLLVREKDGWHAYIIKSATRVSDRNLLHAAYQLIVLEGALNSTVRFSFITINNRYTKQGKLDLDRFFKFKNVDNKIQFLRSVVQRSVEQQLEVLNLDKAPEINTGVHCYEPRPCAYRERCWGAEPGNSVFDLVGFSKLGMVDLWKRGIKTIDKIPDTQTLSFDQEIQRAGKRRVKPASLRKFLENLKHPVFLVDFEGFVPAIPPFENSKPFEVIPFLFAGIYLKDADDTGEFVHHICPPGKDPRREFAEAYLKAQQGSETVLVYDPQVEKLILKKLAQLFPDLRPELEKSVLKIVDLSKPIQRKDFYLPEMKGFYGMKNVLPAVAPELAYDDLEIQSGRMAASEYQSLQLETDSDTIERTMVELVEYCRRDTLGLLQVYRALLEAVK